MTKQTIYYKSAMPGSGKSRSAFQVAANSDQPIIITSPTDKLTLQYAGHFKTQGIPATIISRQLNPNYSSLQHLKDSTSAGHKRIVVNPDVFYAHSDLITDYNVINDEIADPIKTFEFNNAKYIQSAIKQLLDIEMTVCSRYYKLKLTIAAYDIARNGWQYEGIKAMPSLVELCKRVMSPHYDVYILANSFRDFCENKISNIMFWSVMKPSIYGSISPTILGANFKDRLLYQIWKDEVDFREADNIQIDYENLDDQAKRGKILYVSKRKVTGELFNQIGRQKIHDAAECAIAKAFPNAPYIFGINNNRFGGKFDWASEGEMAERVQLRAHGQNGFKDRHLAVYLACQYHTPATYKFLFDAFGISSETVNRDIWEGVFQFLMRTSARDKDCKEPFTWIVPDQHLAAYLQEKIAIKDVVFFDIGIPEFSEEDEIKIPQTKEERKENNTDIKRRKREKEKSMKNNQDGVEQYEGFNIIIWDNKYAQSLRQHCDQSWSAIGDFMRKMHEEARTKNKSNQACFREGMLTDGNNHKLVGNLTSTKLLLLDIDVCKRDPKELSDFLHAQQISHVMCNTFSSTAMEPRVRVIVPLSEAVTPDNYKHIVRVLCSDIAQQFGDDYEVDDGKLTVNAKFHLPTVPQFDHSLFISRNVSVEGQPFKAAMLDVRWFLSRDVIADQPVKRSTQSQRLGHAKETIEDVLMKWSVPKGSGEGSISFYNAAIDLLKIVDSSDAIQILTANRHMFGNGADRDAVYTVKRAMETSKSFR